MDQIITIVGNYIMDNFAAGIQSNPVLGIIVLFAGLSAMAIIATLSTRD